MRWRGREDDSRALLLLCEVLLSRTSPALPAPCSLSSSADTGFDARQLKNSGALVYLLLLLSSLSDARDSRGVSEERGANAEDLCRASEFSRHVLTAAGVDTPQLDARRLRLSFAGARESSQASSSPSLSRGISLKLREEIRAAARRLGLSGSAPRSDASCPAQEVEADWRPGTLCCHTRDEAGDKARGVEADGESAKWERHRCTAKEEADRGNCVSEQEWPWKPTVERARSEGSASHEEDPLGEKEESATDSLRSRVSYASQTQEIGLSQDCSSSLGAPLSPFPQWPSDLRVSVSSVSPVSSVSSLRALFAPVSPAEFSFRRVAALPFGTSASRPWLETSTCKPFSAPRGQLSLCDSGKRPELSSQVPERSREAGPRRDAVSWGGAWRGCFDRQSLAPSLLPPVSEDECPFRLGAEGERLSPLHCKPAPSSSWSLLSPRPASSSASSSASPPFSHSPSSSSPAFPGFSAAALDRGESRGDAFPSAFAREPPRFFPLPQALLPGGLAPTNRRRENGVSFFSAFALEEEEKEAPSFRDRKRELQRDGERDERGESGSLGSQGAGNQEEADGSEGTVRPRVLSWKKETVAASLERERKTSPAQDRAEAPCGAVATPETWEKEMTLWLQSQETARPHTASAVVADRGFLKIRHFASWDLRLLQPRIQRVAESLRTENEGDAGATAHAWTAQMLRCMDTRTAECMGTFLATAYGTMTVGGLDNRFALLSGNRPSVRGKDPPVRLAASLVSSSSSSSSSASSSMALCRLSLSSVLSSSPPPLPPFAAPAPPPGQGGLGEPQMAALGSMDFLSKVADPAWTPVFEEIADMSPLLNFLENWVFQANVSDPADEFLRASPGALSTVSSPALEFMSSRLLSSSGPGDFSGGDLLPRDGEFNRACVSSLFSEERAQPRWADRAARVVGEASQVTFVLPSFLLSVQQEIRNSGLLLLILLHASPEAFRAASLASAASVPSAASSLPLAFSSFLAGGLARASPSATGAIVRGALQKGEANTRTSELAVSAPSLTLEGFARALDARSGSSPSFFSSQPFAFSSLVSAPSTSSWSPSCVRDEEEKRLPTNVRTTRAGVLEFSVSLRDLLRVERKFRRLHARGLSRVARLVEARQVEVHLAEVAREEVRRRARAALHQRIRLSHQTQLLQLQRARVSREMVLVAAALASQRTSCPSLAEVWNEVLRRQREEQRQLLDEQRQAQAAEQQRREEEEDERRKDSHLCAREERVQAELERKLRDRRREYEQLEEQLKRLQQLQRDLRMSLPSLALHGEGLSAQNTQCLLGRRAGKTRLESRKVTAGLAHAEHAVQTTAAALASVEQALETRRERKRSRGDAGETREEGQVSQPPGGHSVVGVLLKGPEIEVKGNERGTRLPSPLSPTSSPCPASSCASLPSASSSREAARNEPLAKDQRRNSDSAAEPETLMTTPGMKPRHPRSSPAPMSTPQEARTREEEERAEGENSDVARDETREDRKTETRCRPAVSEANQGTTSAWTTTAASSPRACDSVSSNEETPQESSQERFEYEELEEERSEDAGRGIREAGHWQTDMERKGEQGNLNRSIWTCIGRAVATQHAIANRAFLALMGRQHCDLLGTLDTVKKFILFGASDSMGQFAVALVAELQKKEEEKLQGAFSAAAAAGASSSDPGSRQPGCTYTRHLGSSLAIHVARYTERINALFASALAPIRSSASRLGSADGGVVPGLPVKPFEFFPSLHGHSRGWSETSDAGLGFRSKMTVAFQLSEGKPATGGADVGPDASVNRGKAVQGRNVEDLLKDVEVVLHAPFPLTLFFDVDTGRMYTRIFQFLTLLSFSLHCIHHVWLHLSRLHRLADACRGQGRLRPRVFLREGEERFGFSVSPRGVESRRNSASRDCGESDGRGVHSGPTSDSRVHASARFRGETRDEKEASADTWREDGFLLPPGLYAHMWHLSVKVKFVTDALHGYVITDALQAEWTALTMYVQRTVEAALGPPRLRRLSKGFSRDASPQPVLPASEASSASLRQHRRNSVALNSEEETENAPGPSKARAPALAPGVRTPQRRSSRGANQDETPERPEVQDGVTGRPSASECREKEACSFELFAAHRKTVSSIHTRCLLSPRLAPLHQHVMDVLRASWALRGLQEQLERDERHLRDLLAPQRKKWSELRRRRRQMQSAIRGVSAEETGVVRASFATFDKTENGNMFERLQREEEAILAAKRGIERAGVAAGLVAAQQLLKIEKLFQTACDGLMTALQKLEPLQLLDALALRLDFNHFYSRQAALKAARASVERRLREV
ncbi:UNVERIFIED_CONTAM: hypothetical protein HHA_285780 [Hammondia hammondi]|eukprot:XP_008884164.1 hypothetical protein HHA_285780 [Hammondia hammondi]